MLKRIILSLSAAIFVVILGWGMFAATSVAQQDVPRISIEQLNRSLGNENLVIIDSRSGSDWRGSEFKIKGAIRGKLGQEKTWAKDLPKDAEIVVYCA